METVRNVAKEPVHAEGQNWTCTVTASRTSRESREGRITQDRAEKHGGQIVRVLVIQFPGETVEVPVFQFYGTVEVSKAIPQERIFRAEVVKIILLMPVRCAKEQIVDVPFLHLHGTVG